MASRLSIAGEGAAERTMLRCWGDIAIADASTGIDLRPRGRKARALLAYLAMHPGKPVSREKLTGLLWSERADEQARASLRQTLFELRPFARTDRPLLEIARESVTLDRLVLATDIDALRALCDGGDYDGLLTALPDADDTLFANLDGIDPGLDDWLQVERTRQHDALVTLVADASAGAVIAGKTRAARALHARLLEFDPAEHRDAPAIAAANPEPTGPTPAPRRVGKGVIAAAAALLATAAAGGAWWADTSAAPVLRAPSREVQGLYDTARGIIYQRKGSEYSVAADLLRRAIALDPNFAPGWASLGAVTAMSDHTPAALAEGERHVRRALALDPMLADAHGALGMVLGFKSAEARSAIKRAAALGSRNPEILYWLSNVHAHEGNYAGQLAALRRAATIDPLWHRSSGKAALAAWEMGYRQDAANFAEQLRKVDLRHSYQCAYAIDWSQGDYAEIVKDTIAIRRQLHSSDAADMKLGNTLITLGHIQPARVLLKLPPELWQVASGGPPSRAAFEKIDVEAKSDGRYDHYFETALQQVLNARRAAEIVALYDGGAGRIRELARPDASNTALVSEGPNVALALRAVGRQRDADALLARANAAIRRSRIFGGVPNWFHAMSAQTWAVQGLHEAALDALGTAIDRGWHFAPMTPQPDIADIPAFRELFGKPRFEALRRRLLDHVARERRELGPVSV